jgi:hypothetical protein
MYQSFGALDFSNRPSGSSKLIWHHLRREISSMRGAAMKDFFRLFFSQPKLNAKEFESTSVC